ncbi:MAG: Gfo/Idh/MocA family oxidoreductase [Kiritimatiellaeota bacterium]|nr:Gfo/Idh/MocA family oxidoreductase [Kiritimatiellota bacterium]
MSSRREFLKNAALMGAGAVAMSRLAGCKSACPVVGMGTRADMEMKHAPIPHVRVGLLGIGNRGKLAVRRLTQVPGVEIVAMCDSIPERVEAQLPFFKEQGLKTPKVFSGTTQIWRKMCELPEVDIVYICTPWLDHTPMSVHAMRCGKHVGVEVPAAMTVDECWELVEISEKTRRHCMMLENCCYGRNELLALNLCRTGVLGELVHGEAAYIHEMCAGLFNQKYSGGNWRGIYGIKNAGNSYPTHGLGPVSWYMSLNRGDKMDYLVSVESAAISRPAYAAEHFGAGDPRANPAHYKNGNMNVSLVKTQRGRTIVIQHDIVSPRPYTRLNVISGSKGILSDFPLRVAMGADAHDWLKPDELEAFRVKHEHPLWKQGGDKAMTLDGAHGGMDYIMDCRLFHCLQKGLPLDMDVYDAALWSCLVDLTKKSCTRRAASVDVPDFTRGAWKTAKPLSVESMVI